MAQTVHQINELWPVIRPYLLVMTIAVVILGLLAGWAWVAGSPSWSLAALVVIQVLILLVSGLMIRRVTATLLQGRERYRKLIDRARDVIFTFGLDGRLTSLNPAFETFTGWVRAEWLGRPFEELILEEDRARARDQFQRTLRGETLRSIRLRVYTRVGKLMVVEANLSPETKSGQVVGLLGIARDITEEQAAEDALRASETRLRALLEGGWDAFTLTDREGTIVYASPSMARVLDHEAEDLVGLNAFTLFHPDDLELARGKLLEVLQSPGGSITAQVRTHHGDGSWRWLESVVTNLLAEPSIQGLVINYRDITERKLAEDALRKSEERYRAIFQTSGVSIWEEDFSALKAALDELRSEGVSDFQCYFDEHPDFVRAAMQMIRVIDVNQITLKIYGATDKAQLLGSLDKIFGPNSFETFKYMLNALAEGKSYVENEVIDRTLQGAYLHLWRTIVFPSESASFKSVLVCLTDLTEHKKTEEALRESRAQLSGIIASAMDAIITLDADQRIILFNTAAEEMFGCRANEVIGGAIDRLIPQRFRGAHHEHVQRFGESGLTARSMRRHTALTGLRCDGSEFPIEASISRLDTGGQKLYTVIVRDITERKKAEEDLRAAEARYRTLVEQLPIVVYINPASDIESTVYVSPQIKSFLGYTQEEWLANPKFWAEAIHPEDRQYVLAEVQHINQSGKPFDVEYRLIARDGRVVWTRDQAILLHDSDGQPLIWQGLMADITESKLAEQQIKRQINHLRALRLIDMAITSSTDLHLSLQIILKQAVSQLQIDAVDILLLNPITHTLEYAVGVGFRTKDVERSSVRLGDAYTGRAVMERRTISIQDLRHESVRFPRNPLIEGENFISYFAVPLIVKGGVKGILEVFQRQPLTPDPEWLEFLEALAGQAALAIDNSTLFESLQRSNIELSLAYETTLEGWSAALDLRDKETEGHTRRVVELTLRLAEYMGLKDKELVHIRRGALLHDIGKMGVPDRILLKPEDLTPDEWEIMQRHPTFAYELLSRIEYLHPALAIPYCHHEKWDGTGYPRGLKGEEIPLEARIFAVVDVYDAITSDRPYRPAWSKETSLEHIQSLSGAYFDPKVVKAFLELLAQG